MATTIPGSRPRPVGAALGVLLDRSVPDWKDRYLVDKFALERYVSGSSSPSR
ncbi:MAG: hypothetical protein ACE5GX_18185 [Thermoanaerobaculia bacterium]